MIAQLIFNSSQWVRPILIGAGACLTAIPAAAQIVPDETLGNERSRLDSNRPLRDQLVDRIEGGAVRGANLFHSFQEFNVREGQRVYFANPVGIENILSRVTGSNSSRILGTLGVDGVANLFLLNPNGIVFGANARLDVRGSFVASTGNKFQFPDGSVFSATNPQAPPLLVMNITPGLQYGKPVGDLTNAGLLAVGTNQSLTLLGNTVTNSGSLVALGGRVEVLGDRVALIDHASIDVSALGGGGTVLIGGDFQGKGTVPTARHTFIGSNVRINADAIASGNGGTAIVWADDTTRFYGSISTRGGVNSGNGGFVEVSGKHTLDFNGRVDTQAPRGLTGTLLLDPTNIEIVPFAFNFDLNTVDDFADPDLAAGTTQINAFALNAATANITLQATNNIIFRTDVTLQPDIGFTAQAGNDILIDSFTLRTLGGKLFLSAGRNISVINPDELDFRVNSGGGDLALKAGGDIIVRNAAVDTLDRVGSGGNRIPGNMTVETGRLLLQNNGQLNTGILVGSGNAGNIDIRATEIAVIADPSDMAGKLTGISTSVRAGRGDAGKISIDTNRLTVEGGGQIGATNETRGNAGDISIRADIIDIDELEGQLRGTGLYTFSSRGNAGDITIDANQLRVQNGAVVNVSEIGGNGGDLTIRAREAVNIRNGSSVDASSASPHGASFSDVYSGGNLVIETPNFTLQDQSTITTGRRGGGSGGSIAIRSSDSALIGQGSILAAGGIGSATGGNLSIETGNLIAQDSATISSTTVGNGKAGDLTIRANNAVTIAQDSTLASTAIGAGAGGNLTITTKTLNLLDSSRVGTSSFDLEALNTVDLENPDFNLFSPETIAAFRRFYGTTENLRQFINSSTTPTAQRTSGNLTIQAAESVTIADRSFLSTAASGNTGGALQITTGNLNLRDGGTISSAALSQGTGGNIQLRANNLAIDSGGRITSRGDGRGNAADITVNIRDSVRLNNGEITATSELAGGGNITVNADDIRLRGSSLISVSVFDSTGGGGNINLTSNVFLAFDDSDILANARFGPGGNITITAPAFVADLFGSGRAVGRNPGAFGRFRGNGRVDISVDSEFGRSGTLTIPTLDPSRGLAALPVNLVDPSRRIAPNCATQGTTKGSYVETGQGGLPPNPGDIQGGETIITELASAEELSTPQAVKLPMPETTPQEIVEATAIVRGSNNVVTLVANPEFTASTPSWIASHPCAERKEY